MAYNQQFLKFTFLFKIVGTDEIADTSINYTRANPAWAGAAATLAELTDTVFNEMGLALYTNILQSTGGRWADYSKLTGLKAAAIGVDGSYVAEPKSIEFGSVWNGNTIGNPAQVTTCISMRSGFTLGGGNHGRMYVPHFYMSQLTASPYTDGGQANTLANGAATCIESWTESINTVSTAPLYPAIMSQAGAGTAKEITEVRVGNVSDTQRRRRNALNEVYSTVAVG